MADYLVTDTELTDVADAIREKGGTSEALAWPTGYVDAIGAISGGGGGTTKTVEVTLTSPKHASEAQDPACILYESDDLQNQATQIGAISSPTGSTTVTLTKPILQAVFFSNSYIETGYAHGLQGVYGFSDSIRNGHAFFVDDDGYAYVSNIDYDG